MNLEIERRFIVDPDKLPELNTGFAHKINQGYFRTPVDDGVVRVRTSESWAGIKFGFITTKFKQSTGTYQEFEYEIPYEDAEMMISKLSLSISKTRFVVPMVMPRGHCSLRWEIDNFHGCFKYQNIWIAEIELLDMDTEIKIPEWCIREITDEAGMSNLAAAQMPETFIEKYQRLKFDREVVNRSLKAVFHDRPSYFSPVAEIQ